MEIVYSLLIIFAALYVIIHAGKVVVNSLGAVARYMNELEASDEVTQVGETGRSVTYKLTR